MSTKHTIQHSSLDEAWRNFQHEFRLSNDQIQKFKRYAQLLIDWNDKFNITTITDVYSIIDDHFKDSIALSRYINVSTMRGLADIGSGGGFPGIPLKILFPEVPLYLIEVNQKKGEFLREIACELDLFDVELCLIDWRTFLRKTDYSIDLFCARASLQVSELLRMFKPDCPYRGARLVYWASRHYQISSKEKSYVENEQLYTVGAKQRWYIFFQQK